MATGSAPILCKVILTGANPLSVILLFAATRSTYTLATSLDSCGIVRRKNRLPQHGAVKRDEKKIKKFPFPLFACKREGGPAKRRPGESSRSGVNDVCVPAVVDFSISQNTA